MGALLITSVAALTTAKALFVWGCIRSPERVFSLVVRQLRRAAGLHTAGVQIGDHWIAYTEGGAGRPLVLLHGFGGNKDHWLPISRHLTRRYRVIAPDLPGFGESSRVDTARYAVADQVERLHAFTRALGIESFDLGGNSMGGHIAAAYAARYPDPVASLWLLAPGGVQSARASELIECLMRGDNPLLVRDAAGFDRLMALCFARAPYVPRPFKTVFLRRAIAERPFNDKVFRDYVGHPLPLESLLSELRIPTLVLWGDRDRVLDVSGAAILGTIMPHASVRVLRECGHAPMIERPRETAEAFLGFRHNPA